MVQINDSLFLMGRDFGNKVGDAVTSRNFRSLAPVRQRFEDFIDSSSAHLSAMKDVYGSGSMRKTEIDLLGMEKKMVVNDFGAFERLSSFATMQEITGLFDKIKEESKAESDKRSNFIREQRIYAKRNGYELALNGMAQ